MHDIPDTEDMDAAAEQFWPEGYKDVLWSELIPAFSHSILEAGAFKSLYEQVYKDDFTTYDAFVQRLGEMVAIGAENGTDTIFDEIYAAVAHSTPLPALRSYARHYWPDVFPEEVKDRLLKKVMEEYRGYHPYEHIHEDHYEGVLSFEAFLEHIASLVLAGAQKGADDMIGAIYRSFLASGRLPIVRRRPRRIR